MVAAALAFTPTSCPARWAFGEVAELFGCGQWRDRSALYLHQAFQYTEVLPDCLFGAPHNPRKVEALVPIRVVPPTPHGQPLFSAFLA